MKATKLIAALAFALTALAATPAVEAGSYRRSSNYCKPYVVRTCEVNRCRDKHTAYDSCGNRYCYYVTVVTYRACYRDGSSSKYTCSYLS